MVARDQFSGNTPQFWYFWIGALLVAVVMFLPNGILGASQSLHRRGAEVLGGANRECPPRRAGSTSASARWSSRAISVDLPQGARHALIGRTAPARPPDQPDDRDAAADAGEIRLGDEEITRSRPKARHTRAGAHLPDQHAVPNLNALEAVTLRCASARGWHARGGSASAYPSAVDEAPFHSHVADARRRCYRQTRERLRPPAPARDRAALATRPKVLLLDEPPPACRA